MEHFNDADQLIVIDNNGSVTVEADRDGLNQNMLRTLMGEDQEHAGSDEDEAKAIPAKAQTPFVRQSGDVSLYAYYLKSIRKRVLVVFTIFMAFVAALESFPGTFPGIDT